MPTITDGSDSYPPFSVLSLCRTSTQWIVSFMGTSEDGERGVECLHMHGTLYEARRRAHASSSADRRARAFLSLVEKTVGQIPPTFSEQPSPGTAVTLKLLRTPNQPLGWQAELQDSDAIMRRARPEEAVEALISSAVLDGSHRDSVRALRAFACLDDER